MRIPDLDNGGSVVFSNANGISFGANGATLTASVASSSAVVAIAAGTQTATATKTTVVFSTSNSVSFGILSGTILTASIRNTGQAPVSAGTQSATWGTVIFSNSNGISFGMSGSSIITASISATTLSYWNNVYGQVTKLSILPGNISFFPLVPGDGIFPGFMTASSMFFAVNNQSSQSTTPGTMTLSVGLYTFNGTQGAGGSLSLLNSASTSFAWAAVSNNSTAYSGTRWLSLHSSLWSAAPTFSTTNYWMAVAWSSSSASLDIQFVGVPFGDNNTRLGTMGVANASNNISTIYLYPFYGLYSTTSASLPTSVSLKQVTWGAIGGLSKNGVPNVVFNNLNASF